MAVPRWGHCHCHQSSPASFSVPSTAGLGASGLNLARLGTARGRGAARHGAEHGAGSAPVPPGPGVPGELSTPPPGTNCFPRRGETGRDTCAASATAPSAGAALVPRIAAILSRVQRFLPSSSLLALARGQILLPPFPQRPGGGGGGGGPRSALTCSHHPRPGKGGEEAGPRGPPGRAPASPPGVPKPPLPSPGCPCTGGFIRASGVVRDAHVPSCSSWLLLSPVGCGTCSWPCAGPPPKCPLTAVAPRGPRALGTARPWRCLPPPPAQASGPEHGTAPGMEGGRRGGQGTATATGAACLHAWGSLPVSLRCLESRRRRGSKY